MKNGRVGGWKVYVASSWRNKYQPEVVAKLSEHNEVYDFRNPAPGNNGFAWSSIDPEWQSWTPLQYMDALEHPLAEAGFKLDMDALRWCDVCVMVMPCGPSASMEMGYCAGAGKKVAIYIPEIREPDLMVKMADWIATDLEALSDWILQLPAPPSSQPSVNFVSEFKPQEMPNCSVCGALMKATVFRCLSCGEQLPEEPKAPSSQPSESHDHICVDCGGTISFCDGGQCWGRFYVCIRCQPRRESALKGSGIRGDVGEWEQNKPTQLLTPPLRNERIPEQVSQAEADILEQPSSQPEPSQPESWRFQIASEIRDYGKTFTRCQPRRILRKMAAKIAQGIPLVDPNWKATRAASQQHTPAPAPAPSPAGEPK